jgi:NAD+ kinase
MRFILRVKSGYGEKLREKAAGIIESNGAEWTTEIEKGCDFALVFGGDGTVMRDQSRLDCPVLGINPGRSIGYYLRADEGDMEEKITRLINGANGRHYHVFGLMRLEASVNGVPLQTLALNDVLISPIYVRRMLKANLDVCGGRSLERNSGIIVYTPTGSHAFAHSAGASRMRYDSGMMGVAGFAPYSGELKKKAMLLDRGPVKVECLSEEGEVCIDGSEVNLRKIHEGDVVTVRKSGSPFRLVGFQKDFE